MKTFNILGCCILRDIFRIAQDDELKVDKFIQFVSPMSFMEEPQNCSRVSLEALSEHSEWSNFCKRNVCFDFNKSVLQTIREAKTDYIVIDLSELRFPVLRCTFADGSKCLATAVKYQKILVEECKSSHGVPMEIVEYEEWKPSPEEMKDTIERYAQFLVSLYDANHIIIVENHMQYRHIDDEAQGFHEYYAKGLSEQNRRLDECYTYLRSFIPHAHYIRMPDHCLGDAGHLWGKDPLHFTDAYYRYLHKAVRVVLEERADEEARLTELRNMYSAYFELLEKQKRMEYFITALRTPPGECGENFLQDSALATANLLKGDPTKRWHVSMSKGSLYDADKHWLVCGNETTNWAILQQDIDLEALRGKTVCLSVRYMTFEHSMLNIAIRCKKADNSLTYLATKQCCCDDYDNIDSLVAVIPDDPDIVSAHVAIYLNKPSAKAMIHEVKLESGDRSSLF